jgi:hypothetical protein
MTIESVIEFDARLRREAMAWLTIEDVPSSVELQ